MATNAFMPTISGESPPPPPRACFGRNGLIEEIIGFTESLTPIALIGAGGIGKTSIALTVLHDDRIKKRFGKNRWFIRCDQFPASHIHFLSRLSKVIGAGAENPEDMVPLRPFLSSRDMIIFLDNVESILDPQGASAQEIYDSVEELSRFSNICLCVTSRISTVPPHFRHPIIPALSVEAACDIFYGIHNSGGRSDIISNLLKQLDFHPLSITLLATVASHNMWDYDRVAREWDTHLTQVLQTDYDGSLAATVELSLASSMFCQLGPDARDLLGVIAFFPQGIDEKNTSWLFPITPSQTNIFDKFCMLSLTYRSNGFITMLAPLRDYLCPKSPEFSPLLHTTKRCYFRRLSVYVDPGSPGFEEAQWITSEDVNVEHLLDVFTSSDTNMDDVWNICANFMGHLYWHKPRPVILGSKIERLPDSHPSKPSCLFELSRLFGSVGNHVERKRLLVHTLKLWGEQGNDLQVADTLGVLAVTNRRLGLYTEGIWQAKESLEIFKRFNHTSWQAYSLQILARLLYEDGQLDAAEEAASQSINLLPDRGEEYKVCQSYNVLGDICCSKGEAGKAISYFGTALRISSSFNWHDIQFWILYSLAGLFFNEGRFDDAHTHIELAKSHVVNVTYLLGCAMHRQSNFWYLQHRLEEARSGALYAVNVFEKLGAVKGVRVCRELLQWIEEETNKAVASDELDFNGELLDAVLLPMPVNSSSLAHRSEQSHLHYPTHTLMGHEF